MMRCLNIFQSVAQVIVFNFEMTRGIHHKFHSSHTENLSVETHFTHTNVYDDYLENN